MLWSYFCNFVDLKKTFFVIEFYDANDNATYYTLCDIYKQR